METSIEYLKLGHDNVYILFPVCFSLNNVSLDALGALFLTIISNYRYTLPASSLNLYSFVVQ